MIEISKEAEDLIKTKINGDKLPRIILKNGGCAGHILVLTLDKPASSDIIIESSGITFAVEPIAEPYINNISIYLKHNLGSAIIIQNNDFKNCKCGKSFKI